MPGVLQHTLDVKEISDTNVMMQVRGRCLAACTTPGARQLATLARGSLAFRLMAHSHSGGGIGRDVADDAAEALVRVNGVVSLQYGGNREGKRMVINIVYIYLS